MNIGMIVCVIMAGLFIFLAIIFTLLKEKGTMLIGGFNTLPKAEREQYDQLKMSIDMRNSLFIWSFIFIAGGIVSYIVNSYMAIIAFVVWLVLFFRDVHLDAEKAFSKYKK